MKLNSARIATSLLAATALTTTIVVVWGVAQPNVPVPATVSSLPSLEQPSSGTGQETSSLYTNNGIWIGGEYQDLTAHIPTAHGQGFLFQPNAMPPKVQTWYAQLATLIGNIWDNFGHPDSAGSPPQTTIPPQVDAMPEATGATGATVQHHGSLAHQLKNDLHHLVSNESVVAGLVLESKENITEGRKTVIDLVDSINDSMPASAGVPAMYETIDNAITQADAILTSYLNQQHQIADKVHTPTASQPSSGTGQETSTMHMNADQLAPLARATRETGQETPTMHINADQLAPLARATRETGQETPTMHINADQLTPLARATRETGQETPTMHTVECSVIGTCLKDVQDLVRDAGALALFQTRYLHR
jgi:hypothetical protein